MEKYEKTSQTKKRKRKVRQLVQHKSGNFQHVCNYHKANLCCVCKPMLLQAHLYAAQLQFAYIERKINVPLWIQNSIIFFDVSRRLIGGTGGSGPIKLPLVLCFWHNSYLCNRISIAIQRRKYVKQVVG